MDRTTFAIITFANSHLVLKGEKALEQEDIKVIPLPSEIATGCGLCIMCSLNKLRDITTFLKTSDIQYKKTYKVTKNGLNKQIEEINL